MAREKFTVSFTSLEKTDAAARSILAQNGYKKRKQFAKRSA